MNGESGWAAVFLAQNREPLRPSLAPSEAIKNTRVGLCRQNLSED